IHSAPPGRSRDERTGSDARRRKCQSGECHRERVGDTTCDVRGRAEAVSVSTKKKKPNPGLIAPRAGGRAKWPSHFGRDPHRLTVVRDRPQKVSSPTRLLRRIPPPKGCTLTNVSLCPPGTP